MTKEERRQYLKVLDDVSTKLAVLIDKLPDADEIFDEWTEVQYRIEEELKNIQCKKS